MSRQPWVHRRLARVGPIPLFKLDRAEQRAEHMGIFLWVFTPVLAPSKSSYSHFDLATGDLPKL
eukprot:4987019-Pyramimonas_sp.AAC.1